jgi:hypothetical protein
MLPNEPFRVGIAQPIPDPPLARTLGRTQAERWLAGLGLHLPQLPYRANQRVCEVQAV